MKRALSLSSFLNIKTATIAAIICAFLFPLLFSSYQYAIMLGCFIGIYIIAVSGLDILFGYCGQISLGHAAFYAIGAYGSAIFNKYLNIPVVFSIILGAVVAAIIGMLLAYPASKLVFHFLSLATVAFGEIIYQFLMHSPGGITGEYNGMTAKKLDIFGFTFNSYPRFYYLLLILVIVFLLAKQTVVKSKTGRAFVAIRENVHAAGGMGIHVSKYKIIAFGMSAFYAAFAGALYMHMVGYVHPDMFQQKQSVLFLTMLLFGGTGSFVGPILGVFSIEMLIETLRFLQSYQSFVYGVLLLIVIVALPGGLRGAFKDLYAFCGKGLRMLRTKGADKNAERK